MVTAHSTLTAAELHEPKGISGASNGDVYIANGAGSGTWTSFSSLVGTTSRFVGEVFDFAGSTAPSGSVLCYGQAISRTTYADLFTAIGTTYGAGDGTTTFNVPDCRGRVTAGKDNMGGSSANRLTDAVSESLDGDVLGDTGGEETHTQTSAELAAHSHTATSSISLFTSTGGAHTHTYGTFTGASANGGGNTSVVVNTAATSNTGSSGSHQHSVNGAVATSNASTGTSTPMNNVQPTIIFNKCIFTGVV